MAEIQRYTPMDNQMREANAEIYKLRAEVAKLTAENEQWEASSSKLMTLCKEVKPGCHTVEEVIMAVPRLTVERDELQAIFDLQHTRTMTAIAAWRVAHPGNDLAQPDLGKLLEWLLTSRVELAALHLSQQNCKRCSGKGYRIIRHYSGTDYELLTEEHVPCECTKLDPAAMLADRDEALVRPLREERDGMAAALDQIRQSERIVRQTLEEIMAIVCGSPKAFAAILAARDEAKDKAHAEDRAVLVAILKCYGNHLAECGIFDPDNAEDSTCTCEFESACRECEDWYEEEMRVHDEVLTKPLRDEIGRWKQEAEDLEIKQIDCIEERTRLEDLIDRSVAIHEKERWSVSLALSAERDRIRAERAGRGEKR